jgi:hypothetical protein
MVFFFIKSSPIFPNQGKFYMSVYPAQPVNQLTDLNEIRIWTSALGSLSAEYFNFPVSSLYQTIWALSAALDSAGIFCQESNILATIFLSSSKFSQVPIQNAHILSD